MTFGLFAGLLLQGATVVALVVALRRRVLFHVGALFIVTAVLYHGFTELVQLTFHSNFGFRGLVTRDEIESWVVLVSPAIALCAGVYLAVLGRRRDEVQVVTAEDRRQAVTFFDWRLVALAVLPLYLLTLTGHGFSAEDALQGRSTNYYWSAGLSSQFLVLGLVLIGYGLVVRHPRLLLPVLVAEAAAPAFLGQRSYVAFTIVLLLYALARAGIRPTRRQLAVGGVIVVGLALVISSSRALGSRTRFSADHGASDRASALTEGVTAIGDGRTLHLLLDDYVYRFDGNAYGALLLSGFRRGVPPVGMRTLSINASLAVPSFVAPNKLNRPAAEINEKTYLNTRFGLRTGIDYLPTQLGTIYGYGGSGALYLGAAFFGAAFGLADRWLKAGFGPARLIVALGLVECVLAYESTLEVYFTTLRGILLLVGLVLAVRGVRWLLVARVLPEQPSAAPTQVLAKS